MKPRTWKWMPVVSLFAALAMALKSMPEHLVKKNSRSAARKQRRPVKRFGHWRIAQCLKILS